MKYNQAKPVKLPADSKQIKQTAHMDVFDNSAPDNRPTPITLGPIPEERKQGIVARGRGAATKGFTSRGPMA